MERTVTLCVPLPGHQLCTDWQRLCASDSLWDTGTLAGEHWPNPFSCIKHSCKEQLSSPIASSHKRARSVDTGRDMQQPGPPSKLSRSHSADHLAVRKADPLRAPPFAYGANLADEVDYGDSPDPSPRMSRRVTSSSDDSSPAGSTKPTRKDKVAVDETATAPRPKGVILVSEAFTEINAGLVIVLASGHESPVPVTVLDDPDTDPDEIARVITIAYHRHVEAYLATTYPPADVEQAVASGLLGSPLLGTSTRVTADWCHAWSLLGQWSGLVTFPVPASGVWPRHGHLRKILDGYQGRQPNFHKWAGPAYEQGAAGCHNPHSKISWAWERGGGGTLACNRSPTTGRKLWCSHWGFHSCVPNKAAASGNQPNWARSARLFGILFLALVPNPCRITGRM